MRNTILVPTDFSPNSLSAIQYASHLAQKRNYGVHLLHYYTSTTATFANEGNNEDLLEDNSLLKADLMMRDLKQQLKGSFDQVVFTSNCVRGLLNEKLPTEAAESQYALIILGATGASAKKSYYYGSNTVAITASSPIPVIAVPAGHETCAFDRISLLTKFKSEELETLRTFIDVVGKPNKLSLTHVYREENDVDETKELLESWAFNIREMNLLQEVNIDCAPISKTDINLDTVPEVVNSLIKERNPDLILVTKTRKSFFERLFSTSVSKAIALELTKPAFFDRVVED